MGMIYPIILLSPLSCLNLCSIHIFYDISYNMVDNFSIHSFTLQYKSLQGINSIIKLDKNLSIFSLVVFDSIK